MGKGQFWPHVVAIILSKMAGNGCCTNAALDVKDSRNQ